jgi:hypothetical protein
VYIYQRSGSTWKQQAYLKAANAGEYDYFGKRNAIFGDTVVVGAPFEDSSVTTITNGTGASADNSATDSGAVFIYQRSGSTWAQQAYLKAVNAANSDEFGWHTTISGDTVVVGVPKEDSSETTITNGTGASNDNSASDSGSVYIYQRNGSTWAQQAYLKAANAGAGDSFGWSTAIYGNTVVIGSIYEDSNQVTITNGTSASADNSATNSGAVYIYQRSGSTWVQRVYLKSTNSNASDQYGSTAAIFGNTVVVGANQESSNQITITNGTSASANNSLNASGAVYIYQR